MQPDEAFLLATSIVVRHRELGHFITEDGERAYYDALVDFDAELAAPIVNRMLETNREPWTSTDLARVLFNSAHRSRNTAPVTPPEPVEQKRRMRQGLLEAAAQLPEHHPWRVYVQQRYGQGQAA